MVDDQFGNHPQTALVRLGNKAFCVGHGAVVAMDAPVLGDVIAVVAAWRGIERQQPDGIDAQVGNVVEFGDQTGKITDSVVI